MALRTRVKLNHGLNARSAGLLNLIFPNFQSTRLYKHSGQDKNQTPAKTLDFVLYSDIYKPEDRSKR
jgi:hypothetical protein